MPLGFLCVELVAGAPGEQRATAGREFDALAQLEGVIVGDDDLGAIHIVEHVARHQFAVLVIAVGVVGLEHAQTILDGETRRNDKEAAVWYRKAADNGERAAQFNLGEMFMRGRGVEKSEEEAAQWFSKAAQLDHPGAEYQLGMMYIRGRGGIPKDEGVGLQWLEKAAAQGHEEAKKEVAKRRRP